MAVPTLDDLAERPEAATGLPRAAALALHMRALRVLMALEGPLLAAEARAPIAPGHDNGGDRLLDIETAAARLAESKDWLYRHAGKLPFTVQEGKGAKLRFSEAGIERYIREKQRT